jgi:hypothetical protein
MLSWLTVGMRRIPSPILCGLLPAFADDAAWITDQETSTVGQLTTEADLLTERSEDAGQLC